MAIRNRKQIPVCQKCHVKIHGGNYTGDALNSLIKYNPIIKDNRLIHIESFIRPGDKTYHKNLMQKGWKAKIPENELMNILDDEFE